MSDSSKRASAADVDQHFRTDHLKNDIKKRSVRGGAVTMATQASKFIIGMGSTAILARLLSPQDYGLYGMVTALIGLAGVFNDMGLSAATVQKPEINHKQVSTLFWINVGLGTSIMLVVAVLAPFVAWFYKEPRLTLITLAMSIAFLFSGLTVQHKALLERQMRFTSLATMEMTSMIVSILTGVVSAWLGSGYWALVHMQLAGVFTFMVGVWLACGWRPGLPAKQSGVRSMLKFGTNLTGFNILNYGSRNLDNILIGRVWGAGALGLYAKAYSLMMLPLQQINSPITSVAVPSLSRLSSEPEEFRNHYLKALSLITTLTMPVVLLLLILATEIIELVLGPQWREVAVIFQLLGLSAFVQPITNTSGWLYISRGRSDWMFKWGVFASSFLVLSFFVGLPYGARGVALSYSVAKLVQTWPCMYYATRNTLITMLDLVQAVKPSLLSSLIAGAVTVGVRFAIAPSLPTWMTAIISVLVMGVSYLLIMVYLFKGKELIMSVLKQFKR